MENWDPSVTFEIGSMIHRERLARVEAARRPPSNRPRGGTPRETLATALVALALWIAPSTGVARADSAA